MIYLVRMNCEYSLEIEASSEDEALDKASKVDEDEWSQAWSPMELD